MSYSGVYWTLPEYTTIAIWYLGWYLKVNATVIYNSMVVDVDQVEHVGSWNIRQEKHVVLAVNLFIDFEKQIDP